MRITGIIKRTKSYPWWNSVVEHNLNATLISTRPDCVIVEFMGVEQPGVVDKIRSWFCEHTLPIFFGDYPDGTLLIYSYHEDKEQAKPEVCHDSRHDTPCPLPCSACDSECGSSQSKPEPITFREILRFPCGASLEVVQVGKGGVWVKGKGVDFTVGYSAIPTLRKLLDRMEATEKIQ